MCGGNSDGNLDVKGNSDEKRDPDGRRDYDAEPDVSWGGTLMGTQLQRGPLM